MMHHGGTKGCPREQSSGIHGQGNHRGDDSYFKQWVEQPLNATMGVWPAQETRGGTAMTAQSTPVPAQFTAELSKG